VALGELLGMFGGVVTPAPALAGGRGTDGSVLGRGGGHRPGRRAWSPLHGNGRRRRSRGRRSCWPSPGWRSTRSSLMATSTSA